MKYFCVSDIHGNYDKMIAALNKAGFNKETDTLISLGDLFDRGPQSKEVLEYVMSCPHRLLCIGNHDLRLMQLIQTPALYTAYDTWNGVLATLNSFLGDDFYHEKSSLMKLRNYDLLIEYFKKCRAAFEFSNLIITHGWIPTSTSKNKIYPYYRLIPHGGVADWRAAPNIVWEDAFRVNTEKILQYKVYPDKDILVGHWSTFSLAQKIKQLEGVKITKKDKEDVDSGILIHTFENGKRLIAIDGCTVLYDVNVYTFETDEEPVVYSGNLGKWYYF